MADTTNPHYNKDIIDIYESGKHRRYGLLFAMNGAGYTLAVFLFNLAPRMATPVVGYLLLVLLAVVLGRFSRLMGADIDAFGKRMRDLDKLVRGAPESELYGPIGQEVLASFWTALQTAWGIVGVLAALIALYALATGTLFVAPAPT